MRSAPGRWRFDAAALAGYLALAALVRIGTFSSPLTPDGDTYLYVGRVILHGGIPYVDAIDNKGPATYLLFALVQWIAGGHDLVVQLAPLLCLAGASAALAGYVAGTAGRRAGLAAGAVLAMLGSAPWQGAAVNTEELGILPMAGAWFLATRASRRAAAGAGALVAGATLMNIGFAVVALPVAVELLRRRAPLPRAARLGAAAAGAAALTLPFVAWLALGHALGAAAHDFLGYGPGAVAGHLRVPRDLRPRTGFPFAWLIVLGALGAALALRERRLRSGAAGALGWIAVMLVRAKLSPYDGPAYAHHYYPVVPGVAAGLVLGGLALLHVPERPARRLLTGSVAAAAAVVLVFGVIAPAGKEIAPHRSLLAAAAWLRAHTAPGARVLASGYAPEVYRASGRQTGVPLFVLPRVGIVSRAGSFRAEYRAQRLREILERPPAAFVTSDHVADDDIEAAIYLLRYRRALRTCSSASDPTRITCAEVWVLSGNHRHGPMWGARLAERALRRLGRGTWEPPVLAHLRPRPDDV